MRSLLSAPLRDVVHAVADHLRAFELEQYRHEQLLYVAGGLKKPPDPPASFKED